MVNSELSVITKTKELCSYVMTVTEKSPKRFRFTLVSRMQNYALDVIENLYIANEIYVQAGRRDQAEKRQAYQQKAQTGLRLLGYIAQLAMEQQCVPHRPDARCLFQAEQARAEGKGILFRDGGEGILLRRNTCCRRVGRERASFFPAVRFRRLEG